MSIEVKVPTFPESVADGTLVAWHKKPGEAVMRDEVIADVETDKVVFEIPAPQDGMLETIHVAVGATVLSGQLLATINASEGAMAKAVKPVAETSSSATEAQLAAPGTPPKVADDDKVMPAARKLISEHGLSAADIRGTGKDGRILKEDVQRHINGEGVSTVAMAVASGARSEKRVPMTRLRKTIATRLVDAQHTAAILTTFNEVNMQPVMDLRNQYKDLFEKKHGVRMGFMSFFVRAAVEALKRFPEINASIDGDDIVYHGYYDVGIAVGSPRGLVVPILRDAEDMSIADIESNIRDFGARAKDGKLSIEELTGGTFSITNGGVFGSLLSTPILNPPQSAILGMHKVEDRPIAENGQVVIRPMMYLALSYDHRIVDGKEAVQFLVTIKELVEDPARILLDI
ncbi:MAG: 2-oxoglutarate dehydrogenase complex dihydrolipoyllysine-residue succinyltransferase [Gammaproteobacteria bacterium]|nr:2-oxoglutarate dehydrogenase complex dihydrolipoyllysine-residue succinyltransferase [Gammaproteobacteria bacterium]